MPAALVQGVRDRTRNGSSKASRNSCADPSAIARRFAILHSVSHETCCLAWTLCMQIRVQIRCLTGFVPTRDIRLKDKPSYPQFLQTFVLLRTASRAITDERTCDHRQPNVPSRTKARAIADRLSDQVSGFPRVVLPIGRANINKLYITNLTPPNGGGVVNSIGKEELAAAATQ